MAAAVRHRAQSFRCRARLPPVSPLDSRPVCETACHAAADCAAGSSRANQSSHQRRRRDSVQDEGLCMASPANLTLTRVASVESRDSVSMPRAVSISVKAFESRVAGLRIRFRQRRRVHADKRIGSGLLVACDRPDTNVVNPPQLAGEETTKGPWRPMSPAQLSNRAYLAVGSAIFALAAFA